MSEPVFIFSFRASLTSIITDENNTFFRGPTLTHVQGSQLLWPSITAPEPAKVMAAVTKRTAPCVDMLTPSSQYLSQVKRCRYTKSPSDQQFDSSTESSASESDEESCCEESLSIERDSVLPEDHPFQEVRWPLLQFARQTVKALTYSHNEKGNNSDTGNTDEKCPVLPLEQSFHFSCPFYKHSPKKYGLCLLHHDLRTIDDVIKHLQRHHKKPPYCPMCSQTLDTIPDCDRHILTRTCEIGGLEMPEGISSKQRARLAKRDRTHLGVFDRWECIHNTVFPDAGSVPSPYLDQGCGREISVVRSYWESYGWRCVSDFLASQEMSIETQDSDAGARMSLLEVTLKDLVAEIMEEYEHRQNI
ncbi:hypothetical protein NW762_003634 [Fusarium torreyae]|uniref:C2H2-type domain-containing protein n=1 Tax=Fusarium torreyae TaxID=1237075 RepID=A0A9W8SBC3_9HYPO|nr:hypothetical protein NW762_003634 [Fusarium torreyae]